MNLRVVIVDDEPLALDRLRLAFRAISGAAIVGEARNGEEALALIGHHAPDLVLLDIQMPRGNGLEIARRLAQGGTGPEVVFATAFDTYATEAFDIDVSDYLLKPIRIDRLQAAIDRARRRLEARLAGERISELELVVDALRKREPAAAPRFESELWAPRPGGLSRISLDAIIWIEAARDYLLVHTAHRTFAIRETMSNLGARFDPQRLLRVHRSAYVNKASIEAVERQGRDALTLTLSSGAVVRIGASYREAILDALGAVVPNRISD
ncbi:MAG: LytR/AlgR family response regulator transcription factor [Hyphomonadaceae bacterium]